MHRKIALVGVLLILLSFYPAVAALANGGQDWTLDGGWSLQFVEWGYDSSEDQTWFEYQLVAEEGAQALSHFMIQLCGDYNSDNASAVLTGPDYEQWAVWESNSDQVTGLTGLKFDDLNDLITSTNYEDFSITLYVDGEVGTGDDAIDWGTKWSTKYNTGTAFGPACGGGGGETPTPSGTVEISKTAQNVCVGGTVNWGISASYTLSNATTADLVFTDNHLWGSDSVTAAVSAPGGTYTVPSGTSKTYETAGTKQNSASVVLMYGSTQLDSDALGSPAEVQVYDDQFTLTVTLHRTDTGTNVTNGTVPSGKSVKPRYTVANTGNVALQNIQVFLDGDWVHTFASLGVGATDSWDGPAVTINAENPSADWDAYATADLDPTGLNLAESGTNCGASADPAIKTVALRTGGGGGGGTPAYAVNATLSVSADCDNGFTWTATVWNHSNVTATIDVDFDRPGMEDAVVTLAPGLSTTITRTEPAAASRSLVMTASIAGTGASDSDTAAASLNCAETPPTEGEIPPEPPAAAPEPPAGPPEPAPTCVPVIDVLVVDEKGTGIAGALVRLGGASTTTTADGVATFTSVAAGTHSVTASAFGYNSGSGSVTLAAGACDASTEVVLTTPVITVLTPPEEPRAEPLGNIIGSICLMEGLGNVDVTLANGVTRTAQIPSGGSYGFEGLAAGTYTVSASSNLGADSQQVSIGNGSPMAAVVDFCFQAPPAQAPLPRTGGPVWPTYLGGSALLALGLVFRRRIR